METRNNDNLKLAIMLIAGLVGLFLQLYALFQQAFKPQ